MEAHCPAFRRVSGAEFEHLGSHEGSGLCSGALVGGALPCFPCRRWVGDGYRISW